MAADAFQIDPQATGSGLTDAGQTRSRIVAAGIPALPEGNYVSPYTAAAKTVLSALSAGIAGIVATGLANTATTVDATETTEAAKQISLSE